MNYKESHRKLISGAGHVRVRRPNWAKGAYIFAQRNENPKDGKVTYSILAVAHEETVKADGRKLTLLRPPTPWVSNPTDLAAEDWIEQTDEDAADCRIMRPDADKV